MGFVHIREFFSYAWLKFLKRTPQWYVKELHLKDYFPENYSYLTAMSWHSLSDSGNLPSTEVKKEVTFCFRISKYLAKVWRTFLLVLSLEGKAVLLSFLFFSTFYFRQWVRTFPTLASSYNIKSQSIIMILKIDLLIQNESLRIENSFGHISYIPSHLSEWSIFCFLSLWN